MSQEPEPPLVDSMDDFAQTRGADDLFDSEISAPPQPPPTAPTEPRGHVHGGRGSRGLWARGGGGGTHQGRAEKGPGQGESPDGAERKPHEGSSALANSRHADRTLSGGVKKPKLSEDELAERMARIKLNNQKLTERRRKAEEDESTFQSQEMARKEADAAKLATERKKKAEAEKGRRELDNEREKNRQRKLRAVQNREWDSTKTEEDYNPKGYNPRYRRGAHGAVAGPSAQGPPPSAPTGPSAKKKEEAAEPAAWPALPENKPEDASKDDSKESAQATDKAEKITLPMPSPAIGGGGSWADQVNSGPSTPAV